MCRHLPSIFFHSFFSFVVCPLALPNFKMKALLTLQLSFISFPMQSVSSSWYCRYQSLSHSPPQQNFWRLLFSFRKVQGYPTSLILWLIKFNNLSELDKIVNTEAAAYRCFVRSVKKSEAAVSRSSSKQVFLKISQHSQENTCAEVSF